MDLLTIAILVKDAMKVNDHSQEDKKSCAYGYLALFAAVPIQSPLLELRIGGTNMNENTTVLSFVFL